MKKEQLDTYKPGLLGSYQARPNTKFSKKKGYEKQKKTQTLAKNPTKSSKNKTKQHTQKQNNKKKTPKNNYSSINRTASPVLMFRHQ